MFYIKQNITIKPFQISKWLTFSVDILILYSDYSDLPPISTNTLYAFSGSPPLHPWSTLSQSTSSCSDNDNSWPRRIFHCPSTFPVTLNAQQEPHIPAIKWWIFKIWACISAYLYVLKYLDNYTTLVQHILKNISFLLCISA